MFRIGIRNVGVAGALGHLRVWVVDGEAPLPLSKKLLTNSGGLLDLDGDSFLPAAAARSARQGEEGENKGGSSALV